MKKILLPFLFLIFLFSLSLLHPPKIKAGEIVNGDCQWHLSNQNDEGVPPKKFIKNSGIYSLFYNQVKIKVTKLENGTKYRLHTSCGGLGQACVDFAYLTAEGGTITNTFNYQFNQIDNDIYLMIDSPTSSFNPICKYHISPTDWDLTPAAPSDFQATCALEIIPSRGLNMNTPITLKGTIIETTKYNYSIRCSQANPKGPGENKICSLNIDSGSQSENFNDFIVDNTPRQKTFQVNIGTGLSIGEYFAEANIEILSESNIYPVSCTMNFKIPDGMPACTAPNDCVEEGYCSYPASFFGSCQEEYICCQPEPSPTPTINPYCKICGGAGNQAYPCEHEKCATCPQCGYIPPSIQPLPSLRPLCEQLPDGDFRVQCKKCMVDDKGEYGNTGVWTSVGCISTDLGEFVNKFLYGIGLQFAGAVAFLYFLYGAFLYLTSGGNPEKVAMAKEIIVSSLSGLLLLIFSLFLLKIIAIDILEIPGFVP